MAYGNSSNPLPIDASQTNSSASFFFFFFNCNLFIYFCNNMRTALAWLKNKEEFVFGP